ncbi:hypothetical protein EMIT074MI3_50037 [Bacillus licheniformis]
MFFHAGVAELADALDLGSSVFTAWGFESLHPHLKNNISCGRGGMADALG